MATVEERLARLETRVEGIDEKMDKVYEWVDEQRLHRAAWRPIESATNRVFWLAVGTILPLALVAIATWIRVALSSAP